MKEWQRGWGRRLAALVGVFFLWTAGEAAPSGKTFTTVDHPGAYPTPQNVAAALSDDGRRIVLQWDGVRWPVDGYPGVIDGRDVPTNFYYAVDCRTRASGAAEWDSWWNCSSLSRFASNYGVPGPFLDRVTLTRNAGPGTNYQFRVRCQCNAVWRGEGLYPTPNEDPDPTQDAYFSDWSETVQAYRTLDALALSLVEDAAPTPQGGKTTVEVAYTYTSSRADDGEEPLFFTFEAIEIPDDGWHPEAPAEGQKPYVRRDGTPLAVKTLYVRPPDAAQAVDPTNFTLTASSAAGETRRISWSAWRDLENYYHTNVTIRVQGWAKPEAAGAAPRRVLDEAIGNVGLDTRLPPQNVVASTNDTNAVTVVWDAVPKASGYEVKVERWDVAINRTERTVTVDEACFVDTELPQPGLGRYTVTAVYPNGVKGEPSAPAVGHAALDTMKILGASTRWPWNGTVDLDVEYKTMRPRFSELFGMDNLPYPTNVTLAATTADGAPIAVQTLVKESPLDTGTYTVNRAEVPNGAQDPDGAMIFRGSGRTRLVWDAEADAPDRAAPGATLTLTVSDDRCRTTDSCRIDLDTTKPRAIPLAEEVAEISLPWAARWADETSASLNMQDGSDVKVVAITRYNAVTNVVNTLTMLADEGGMLTNRIDYGVTVLECTFSNRATGAQTTYTRQFIRAPVIPATAVRRPGQNAIDVMWTVVDGCTYYQVVRRTVDRDGTRGAWGNRAPVSPSGAEGCYPDIGVDALTLYEFAVCPKYPDPSDYGYVTAEPVVPSAPVSVLGARLDLYNLSVGDPWDCTVGVDFAYASCRLLSAPTDLAHVSLKDLTGGTNVSARTLALDGASVSNGAFTLDLDPAQGAVSTGRLAWHATADLPNAYLTNVVLEVKMQQSGTTAVTAPFTLDTRGTRAMFDALGPYLAGGATAVTQTVAAAYGALPSATRAGYRLAGWFLGVTNGAPQAREGEAPLRLGPHTLYARWAVDPTVSPDVDAEGNSIYVWEVRPDGQTARICGFRDPNLRVADLVLPDAIGGHPVTEIADCAFANSASGLTALTLPVYCTTVGRRAFSGIKTLTVLAFTPVRDWASPSDAGELAIGAYAFAATGLTAAFLPVEVAQIGDYAFADCRKLTEATVLGRPAVGLRPFRRAGIDAGTKPTIHLHRDLANDADYLGQITQGFGNDVFAVRTDAVVRGLSLGALAVPAPGTVRLSVDVERASTWGEVDASRLRVEYRARLGDAPTDLVPRAVASEPDGSLTVEVDAPEGPSGFFRVKLVE